MTSTKMTSRRKRATAHREVLRAEGDDDDQVKPWRRWETALRLSRQVKSRDGCRVSIGRSGRASSHDRPHVLTFVSLPRRRLRSALCTRLGRRLPSLRALECAAIVVHNISRENWSPPRSSRQSRLHLPAFLLRNVKKYTSIVIPAYLLRGSHRDAEPFNRLLSDCPPFPWSLARGELSLPGHCLVTIV